MRRTSSPAFLPNMPSFHTSGRLSSSWTCGLLRTLGICRNTRPASWGLARSPHYRTLGVGGMVVDSGNWSLARCRPPSHVPCCKTLKAIPLLLWGFLTDVCDQERGPLTVNRGHQLLHHLRLDLLLPLPFILWGLEEFLCPLIPSILNSQDGTCVSACLSVRVSVSILRI